MNPLRAMQEAFRKKFKDSNIASDNYKPLFHQQHLDNQTFLDYENITKVNNYWDDIKYEYSDMGFWGKFLCTLVVLSTIGHIFG